MKTYGCNTINKGPRGRTTTSLMQDGWRVTHRGDIVTREPVMVEVKTEWLPMTCGKLKQAGMGRDRLCAGCENEANE